jgi:hypothetical protein
VSDSLLLVFNELSAPVTLDNAQQVLGLLEVFSDVLADPRCGPNRVLVAPANFLQFPIANGYTVGRWLKLKRGDEPRWRRILLLVDKRRDFTLFDRHDADTEYTYEGNSAVGLSVAHVEDGLAVSIHSHQKWDAPFIALEKTWATDSDVESRSLAVTHAARTFHLDSHIAWLKRWTADPVNGKELWARRAELFPSLDFCESVEEQLDALSGAEPRFKVALRGFAVLESYCSSWTTAYFDIHRLGNASGESLSTLNMYREERTFKCPDGQYRVFEWHLKKGDTRIHFFDFPSTRRILIGYIGNHLRTARF